MNTAEAQEAKHFLLQSHDQYRELAERHHALDDRLHELVEKSPHLSESEQFEETLIKKRKLALKDRMEQIVLEWARDHQSSTS